MTKQDCINLGFAAIPHFTVADALTYNIRRNTYLSFGCVGTPNEMLWICTHDIGDPKKVTDLVCLHNYDLDGYMTRHKLINIINVLAGGVATENSAEAENDVLYDVMPSWRVFADRRKKLDLSMQEVADVVGCSKATISRLEAGKDVKYRTVKAINNFFTSNGA